ncbi:MAG: hypothetical protein V4858_19320 [Pseudomonadota bacterium]
MKIFTALPIQVGDIPENSETLSEFVQRGVAAITETKRSGGGIPAEVVIAKLEARLVAARQAVAQRQQEEDYTELAVIIKHY